MVRKMGRTSNYNQPKYMAIVTKDADPREVARRTSDSLIRLKISLNARLKELTSKHLNSNFHATIYVWDKIKWKKLEEFTDVLIGSEE